MRDARDDDVVAGIPIPGVVVSVQAVKGGGWRISCSCGEQSKTRVPYFRAQKAAAMHGRVKHHGMPVRVVTVRATPST